MNRHIAFILDRSGSMTAVKQATISGYNEYIQTVKKDDPDATFELTLFDTDGIDTFPTRKIKDVLPLNDKTYEPRANTPLWDAIGQVVSRSQDNADTGYLVVVLTDGMENSSREWDREKLSKLIEEKKATNRWSFIYLGSNQDAWAEAQKFGMNAGSTMSYGAGPTSAKAAYTTMSRSTLNWSAGLKMDVSNVKDLLAGVTCADCGQTIEAGKTHMCPKAVGTSQQT